MFNRNYFLSCGPAGRAFGAPPDITSVCGCELEPEKKKHFFLCYAVWCIF